MASNHPARWVGNLNGATAPLVRRGLFQAGATKAIKVGELLELTADTNTRYTPMDSDYDMGAASNVAIAAEEIKSGDRAGMYHVIIPRDGDIFEFDLAAAGANAEGTALYWSDSETVTITAGTNIIGHVVGQEHYPDYQGHLSDDASMDRGETIRSVSTVRMTIELSNSRYALLQVA